jgi:hypothetical protein
MKTHVRNSPAQPTLNQTLNWWENTSQKASELARWILLYEAVNLIADKAEERHIPLDKVEFKPLSILHYIETSENQMTRKVLAQEHNIDITPNDTTYENRNRTEEAL